MIPLRRVYRFISEVCLTLETPLEIPSAALMFFHAGAGALDLSRLGSEVIALATAAIIISLKANEQALVGLKLRLFEILEICVKLSAEVQSLSAEVFAQRRKTLRQKAGFFESVILRVVGGALETPAVEAFRYLEISSPDSDVLRLGKIILADLCRSPGCLKHTAENLAGAALLVTLEVLGKLPEDYSAVPEHVSAAAELIAVYSS